MVGSSAMAPANSFQLVFSRESSSSCSTPGSKSSCYPGQRIRFIPYTSLAVLLYTPPSPLSCRLGPSIHPEVPTYQKQESIESSSNSYRDRSNCQPHAQSLSTGVLSRSLLNSSLLRRVSQLQALNFFALLTSL